MRYVIVLFIAGCVIAPMASRASDPVVTDSRVITEERRLQILEAKLASLQRQVNLIEDHKAIERLQQAWGHYLSEGMATEAAARKRVRFSSGRSGALTRRR